MSLRDPAGAPRLMRDKLLATVLYRFVQKQKTPAFAEVFMSLRDPAGARTQDPYIKSVLLYQLSYRVLFFEGCKYMRIYYESKSNS